MPSPPPTPTNVVTDVASDQRLRQVDPTKYLIERSDDGTNDFTDDCSYERPEECSDENSDQRLNCHSNKRLNERFNEYSDEGSNQRSDAAVLGVMLQPCEVWWSIALLLLGRCTVWGFGEPWTTCDVG
jgi:hypothetical protein